MARARSSRREPTIALINVVFLMLVFFMVAGTIAPPLESDISLVRTEELEGRAPPNALVIRSDGTLSYQGEAVSSAETFVSQLSEDDMAQLQIVPDRDLDATRLVSIARALRTGGVEQIMMVTERGLE